MDGYDQTHNDIKPANFLVKFKNGSNDLTQIEVVLTDFGMADSDSKGGTPIFASPECFEKKEKKSDMFSFGRVILFLMLKKTQFTKWLFVPITDQIRALSLRILCVATSDQPLFLVSQMTSLKKRISLQHARNLFNRLRNNGGVKLNNDLQSTIQSIIDHELSNDIATFTSELCDFRCKFITVDKKFNNFQQNDVCSLVTSNC